MKRSRLLRCLCLLLPALLLAALPVTAKKARKVLVLGVDGLDPKLLQEFIDQGMLPNFERLIAQGDFKPLDTSMPPLSPIAWSTFITGTDPGGHGIFDFVHREAETLAPYLSMSGVTRGRHVNLGNWSIPITSNKVENLRKGVAFWEVLEDQGIPTTVFLMPANFPPVKSGGKAFSGMGTPDIKGTPGTFSFYTDHPPPNYRDISGGYVYPVRVVQNRVEAKLHGPDHPYKRIPRRSGGKVVGYTSPELEVDLEVFLDPTEPVALIKAGGEEFVLRQGEWSPWIRVDFPFLLGVSSVSSVGRFYLKQVRPDFELYVSPLQLSVENPAMPISTPSGWAHDLWEDLGFFYTQELPEDTKALSGGILTGDEFWEQSQFVFRERRRALDYFLEQFDEGFLFFYFSSVDQGSHMLWRYSDPKHPGYSPNPKLLEGIKTIYRELDEAVGHAMDSIDDDTTLVVMSDHGFTPFYWGVNLNSWLVEKGYVTLKNPERQGKGQYFSNVDWTRTTAYALGLNGLYVNLKGRERNGIVEQVDYQLLLDRLERDLLETVDTRNGQKAVTLVIQSRRDFHGPHAGDGPDIIVGYNAGYRSSWESPLGEFPKEVFVDNKDAWSGDHSVDYRLVPGVLLANRKITLERPALYDLTVAILDEYGIEKAEQMIGRDCLAGP